MRAALVCATIITVVLIVISFLSDLFLRPANPQLAEEWDIVASIAVIGSAVLIFLAFFMIDDD